MDVPFQILYRLHFIKTTAAYSGVLTRVSVFIGHAPEFAPKFVRFHGLHVIHKLVGFLLSPIGPLQRLKVGELVASENLRSTFCGNHSFTI